MYQRSAARLGVVSAFLAELKKVPAYASFKAKEGAKAYVDAASETLAFLNGEDSSESPEMREKRRKHKEMYQAILNEQAAKAAAEKASEQQKRAQLSWRQKLQLSLQEAKEAVTQMTSTKAGVMALLQHCTASHAAEVALEHGIDVKNVQMVFEKASASNAVGHEEVVVGYIDAPAASREEVMAFAEKLQKACPMANSMHIEWRQGRADGREWDSSSARRASGLQEEVDATARQMDWAATSTQNGASFSNAKAPSDPTAGSVPAGTPGSRRGYAAQTGYSGSRYSARDGDDGEELHLPGIKRRAKTADEASGVDSGENNSPASASTADNAASSSAQNPRDSPHSGHK